MPQLALEHRREHLEQFPVSMLPTWSAVGSQPTASSSKPLSRGVEGAVLRGRRGERYFEVDVDISSSYAASGVVNIVKGATKSMVIDFGVLIEGQVLPTHLFTPCGHPALRTCMRLPAKNGLPIYIVTFAQPLAGVDICGRKEILKWRCACRFCAAMLTAAFRSLGVQVGFWCLSRLFHTEFWVVKSALSARHGYSTALPALVELTDHCEQQQAPDLMG